MARQQRQFPQGKYILRTPRKSQNGQVYAVYLYYYWQGKQVRRSVDLTVALKDWNQDANGGAGEFRPSYGSNYKERNAYLKELMHDIDSKIMDYIKQHDYKKVILPMMVLRRLDILLEPTHKEVLKLKKGLEEKNIPEASQEQVLFGITGHPFCNTSRFTMKSLRGETNPIRLKQNFLEYLDGFSRDVQDIIEKFKLKQQVDNLSDAGRLGSLIEKFTDDGINLGINPILDKDGNEKQPGVDNHTMWTLFEELLRKFNEENSVTEAGEHFTPRDYVALMADIAVLPVADRLRSATYKVYDLIIIKRILQRYI